VTPGTTETNNGLDELRRRNRNHLATEDGRERHQEINAIWIYPPKGERAAAVASADPERVTSLSATTVALAAGCAACPTETSQQPSP